VASHVVFSHDAGENRLAVAGDDGLVDSQGTGESGAEAARERAVRGCVGQRAGDDSPPLNLLGFHALIPSSPRGGAAGVSLGVEVGPSGVHSCYVPDSFFDLSDLLRALERSSTILAARSSSVGLT